MIYLLAIVLPPLALLLYGRVLQAVVNLVMWVASALIFILTLGVLGGCRRRCGWSASCMPSWSSIASRTTGATGR